MAHAQNIRDCVAIALMSGAVAYLIMGTLNVCETTVNPAKFLPGMALAAVIYGYMFVRARENSQIFGLVALSSVLLGSVVGYTKPWICF